MGGRNPYKMKNGRKMTGENKGAVKMPDAADPVGTESPKP